MKQEKMIKSLSKAIMAYNTLEVMGKEKTLVTVAHGMGYSSEKVVELFEFVNGQVESLSKEKANEMLEKNAHIAYLEAIDEIEKCREEMREQMAQGYQEMGEINLTISQEDHHLEEEGAKLHEVDSKDTKGDTQAG